MDVDGDIVDDSCYGKVLDGDVVVEEGVGEKVDVGDRVVNEGDSPPPPMGPRRSSRTVY